MAANKTRFSATATAGFFVLAANQSFAAPDSTADPVREMEKRMDHYFFAPRSPETFRALSGMGLPAGARAQDDDSISRWWWSASAEEKELLHSLFPSLDMSARFWYPNFGDCRPEAPLQQLRERIARLGAQHLYVAQWVRVERAVFSMCASGRNETVAIALPSPLDVTDPAVALLQQQDRAYQRAAMLFYQDNSAGALAAFQAIANDRASPNRPLAAYMVLAIRAGSHASPLTSQRPSDSVRADAFPNPAPNSVVLTPEQSLQAIGAVLADPSLQSIHAMAASLIGWIGANVADAPTRAAQVGEAIAALMTPTDQIEQDPQRLKRYEAALSDINFLLSGFPDSPDWVLTGHVPATFTASAALAELAKHEPMAAWVGFPTNAYHRRAWVLAATIPESATVRAYLDRMGANSSATTNPWVHENPDTSAKTLSGLVDDELARLKVHITDEQAAAGLALDYYNLIRRLLMDNNDRRGNFEIALQRLERFPYKRAATFMHGVDDSLRYLITDGRLIEARRIRDVLELDRTDGRMPFSSSTDALLILAEDEDHLVGVMATAPYYSREYVNHLTIAELWRLAGRGELSRGQRALFARAAWSREFALERTISSQNDHLLRALVPEITNSWQTPAGGDIKPGDISVVRDVLKSPGLNTVIAEFSRMPDGKDYQASATLTGMDHYNHNDSNWWCAWDLERHDAALDQTLADSFGLYEENPELMRERVRGLLGAAELSSYLFRNINPHELVELSHVKSAPQFLSDQVIAWVRGTGPFGLRAGQAEALADAVLSTRWGCNRQGGHRAYSRAAFELLHRYFPDAPAAKRTTYWFN
jgi:hypothetical protein